MEDFELNIIAGLIILGVDFVLTYLIFQKIVVERDKKRWEPFRLYLYNTLLKSGHYFIDMYTGFDDGFKQKIKRIREEPSSIASLLESLGSYAREGERMYADQRNNILNSIQTALTSLSPSIGKRFTTIFRCIDNSVSLTMNLNAFIYHLKSRIDSLTNQQVADELSNELNEYMIKMNGGFVSYLETVKDIIKAEGLEIVGNEVLTKKEMEWRNSVDIAFEELKIQ
jgi:hypothetical protein